MVFSRYSVCHPLIFVLKHVLSKFTLITLTTIQKNWEGSKCSCFCLFLNLGRQSRYFFKCTNKNTKENFFSNENAKKKYIFF